MGTVTRSGRPESELRPPRRPGLDRVTLLERWRHLPTIDAERFREEIDALIDCNLVFHASDLKDAVGIDGLEVVTLPHPDAAASK